MLTKNSETLKILQYNIRNGRSNVMIPLLAEELTNTYDVLAIQEPWKNDRGSVPTTYSPRNSGFHVVYQPAANNRVCFYVNKNIAPDSWTAAFPSPDIAVLHLTVAFGVAKKDLRIINVYNPSPTSYQSTTCDSSLPILRAILEDGLEAENIVVGDFNLHHPLWNGPSRPTQHKMADDWSTSPWMRTCSS